METPTFFIEEGVAKGLPTTVNPQPEWAAPVPGMPPLWTICQRVPRALSMFRFPEEGFTPGASQSDESRTLDLPISLCEWLVGAQTTVMTGYGTDAFIEDGVRKGGVSTLRFTDSILEALEKWMALRSR